MSDSAPRIDSHHHFWNPSAFEYPWMAGSALDPIRRPFTPDDLAPELAANSIDGTVLVQTISSVPETRQFLDIATTTSFVLGVVGWVDLASPDVGDELDELQAEYGRSLAGIRHQVHDEPDPDWLGRAEVRRGLAALHERGLSYDLLVRTRELPSAVAAASALPEARFVLDHIAKPRISEGWDGDWSSAIEDLAARPNVSVKLSGMVTEADWHRWRADDLKPYIERVIDLFGVERVMFGSDWPVCLLAAQNYGAVVDAVEHGVAGSSQAERERMFGRNAEEFYRLAVA